MRRERQKRQGKGVWLTKTDQTLRMLRGMGLENPGRLKATSYKDETSNCQGNSRFYGLKWMMPFLEIKQVPYKMHRLKILLAKIKLQKKIPKGEECSTIIQRKYQTLLYFFFLSFFSNYSKEIHNWRERERDSRNSWDVPPPSNQKDGAENQNKHFELCPPIFKERVMA